MIVAYRLRVLTRTSSAGSQASVRKTPRGVSLDSVYRSRCKSEMSLIAFGAASPANPAAEEVWDSVRIFGYGEPGAPSVGRTYCGDVWNVIVTVNIAPPFVDRAGVDEVFATQTLDGDLVGATDETAVRWSSTLGTLVQAHGTFLPPGTLNDGPHVIKQTLELPSGFVLWDPDPLTFEVNDSAC